jgi:transposase
MNIDPAQQNDIVTRWKNGQSMRAIASELGLGRHVITRVIRQHVLQTDSADATARPTSLGPPKFTRKSKLDPYRDHLALLLDRYSRLTAQRAFEELRHSGYAGSYSTVRNYIKLHRAKPKARVVRFETTPGAQAQMDWSTYTIDFEQEGRRRVQLFSYILGYSRRQYIRFTQRQDFETTAREHIAAFEHLEGVAAVCLYDNMKVVVTRWEDGQPIYNTRFLSFATHYGFKPWACQARRPETKGKVERPFDYVEKNLLNGRSFRTLEHLNEVARWWLAEINDRRIHGTTKRMPVELHEQEKPYLIELPSLRFDTAQVVYRMADSEGFISYADNRYSVPWQLVGLMLPVRILEDQLQIYNSHIDLVGTHNLLTGKNQKQVDPAHEPPKDHQQQLALLREKYSHWGPIGLEYFDGVQRRCRYGKHEAARILSLLHGYPYQDGLAAMQRGIQYHAYGFQSLERILAHFGTPKANWEVLSEREQQALQRLTESTRVEARRSEEYQKLLEENRAEQDGQTDQPPREDPPVSGDPENEDDRGAA